MTELITSQIEDTQKIISPDLTLIPEIEIVDVPPSLEETTEKNNTDSQEVMQNLNWLQKAKQNKEQELATLEQEAQQLREDMIKAREHAQTEINKMGEVITKKIAALEVYKQIRTTSFILIALILSFLALHAGVKFSIGTTIIDVVFLAIAVWHYSMIKKKMVLLKTRYAL